MFIQAVTINQTVSHFDSLCFHRMFLGKLIFGDLLIVKVSDFGVHFGQLEIINLAAFLKRLIF